MINAQPRQLAQNPLPAERRVALVIGNGNYQNAGKLANPVNDARDVSAALKELKFEVLYGEDLSVEQMKRLTKEFGEKLKKNGGVGLFYYAGHGVQLDDRNYLIPIEANLLREQTIEFEAVDVNRVTAEMGAAGNGFNIVILDACRNNPFARGWSRSTDSSGLAQISAPTGTIIAYATAPGKTAGDGTGRNGLYTAELLKQIRTPGVTLEEVFKTVRAEVRKKSNGLQVPWESSSIEGVFYFTQNNASNSLPEVSQPKPTDDVSQGENTFWRQIENSQDAQDFEEYLKEYPGGIYAATARLKLRKLKEINEGKSGVGSSNVNSNSLAAGAASSRVRAESLAQQALKSLIFGDSENAARLANEALGLEKTTALALAVRGRVFNKNRNFEAARADLEKAVQLDSQNGVYLAWLTIIYSNSGNSTLAEVKAKEALRLLVKPNTAMEYEARATTYSFSRNDDNALADLTKAIELEPKFAMAYYNRGNKYEAKKEFDRAITDFTKAIEIDPKFTLAYYNRSRTFVNKKEYDRAFIDLTKAIELDPKLADAYNGRGLVYEYKNESDRAIADFTKAIELDPTFSESYRYRGKSYSAKKEYNFAIADFTRAIELDSNNAVAYFWRANIYLEKIEFDRSINDFTRAVELDSKLIPEINPQVALAYSGRGYQHQLKREFDRAITDFTSAIALNPKADSAYFGRATTYLEKRDFERAIKDLTKAIELNPNKALYYKALVFVYEAKGDQAQAEMYRRKADQLEGKTKP